MKAKLSALAAAAIGAALCSPVHAAESLSFGCVSDPLAGCNALNAQFAMTVDAGTGAWANYALFTFENKNLGDDNYASTITGLYFDDSRKSLFVTSLEDAPLSPITVDSSDAPGAPVAFSYGENSSNNFPAPDGLDFTTTTGLHADADPPPTSNGLSNGEWLTVGLRYAPGVTFSDVLLALGSTDPSGVAYLRTGIHVQQIAALNGGSASYMNNELALLPIPEPHEYAMLLAGLGLIGVMMWRRDSTKGIDVVVA